MLLNLLKAHSIAGLRCFGISVDDHSAPTICRVSTGWIIYNYLEFRHLVEGCEGNIMELLQSDQESRMNIHPNAQTTPKIRAEIKASELTR